MNIEEENRKWRQERKRDIIRAISKLFHKIADLIYDLAQYIKNNHKD